MQSGFNQVATTTDEDINNGSIGCSFPTSFDFFEGQVFGNTGGGSRFSDLPNVQMIQFDQGERITSIRMRDAAVRNGPEVVPVRLEINYSDGTTISSGNGNAPNRELVFAGDEYITQVIVHSGGLCLGPGVFSCITVVLRVEVRTNKGNSISAGNGLPSQGGSVTSNVIEPDAQREMIVGFHGSAGDVIDSFGVVIVQRTTA